MSDEGDKTCPLCAEEMDLTDQQLRPCKCGYEICVWCWHHIMDMAEKDNTDGRCPACRTPYNKEKIVGTTSKCERLVTVEKKQKSQKGKTKTLEVKKQQLGSVRVIQRNLVYIVGLPLNLADEDLLQQKEYFGQYGKVLKVSISRTATGAIQQFANSTCSVYITYSKEEEAVRSIQSAHGFVLEGRTLRACFGTTKYCHAWLRNAPCTNADCLYLHEFGPQEDSFTKDEIISAYTRNRVQQITGVTNEMQRRSGNLLPPPLDDYSIDNTTSAWPKPVSKITTNQNPANGIKVPLPNISSGKSVALPAAASWGTRGSNSQLNSSKELSNQKPDASTTTVSSNGDGVVKEKGSLGNSVSTKEDVRSTDKKIPDKLLNSENHQHYSDPVVEEEEERRISPLSVDKSTDTIKNSKISQPCGSKQFSEALTTNETQDITKQSDLVSDLENKLSQVAISEAEEDMLCFDNQRLMDTQVIQNGYYPVHAHTPANGGVDPLSSSSHHNTPVVNGYSSSVIGNSSNGHSYFDRSEGHKGQNESSIISNILSMDFDPWDESLTSPRNMAKFLGESNNKEKESHNRGVLGSRKAQNSKQSRFSFARQDEGSGYGEFGVESDFAGNGSFNLDNNKVNIGNGFPSFRYGESENFASNYFPVSENNKIPVSRAQVSAPPPGFTGLNRAPPPGFKSQEQTLLDSLSGNHHQHMFEGSSLLRKTHETATPVNMKNDLGELMDPAILAVGSRVSSTPTAGLDMMMRSSNYHHHSPLQINDVRLQLLMQRSFSQQNPPPSTESGGVGGLNYPPPPTHQMDSYGIPSNNFLSHQQQAMRRRSSYQSASNGNDIGMAGELLRNERFNTRYYSVEGKFHNMPTSPHLYNNYTTFGI